MKKKTNITILGASTAWKVVMGSCETGNSGMHGEEWKPEARRRGKRKPRVLAEGGLRVLWEWMPSGRKAGFLCWGGLPVLGERAGFLREGKVRFGKDKVTADGAAVVLEKLESGKTKTKTKTKKTKKTRKQERRREEKKRTPTYHTTVGFWFGFWFSNRAKRGGENEKKKKAKKKRPKKLKKRPRRKKPKLENERGCGVWNVRCGEKKKFCFVHVMCNGRQVKLRHSNNSSST